MTETTHAKLPVTVTKNPGRGSGYTASYGNYPYSIEAQGTTASEAREKLSGSLILALATMLTAKPAFAREDDSGAVWAAMPAADGGSYWYRVTQDSAWGGTSSSQPTSEAFTACVGMTVIPAR